MTQCTCPAMERHQAWLIERRDTWEAIERDPETSQGDAAIAMGRSDAFNAAGRNLTRLAAECSCGADEGVETSNCAHDECAAYCVYPQDCWLTRRRPAESHEARWEALKTWLRDDINWEGPYGLLPAKKALKEMDRLERLASLEVKP